MKMKMQEKNNKIKTKNKMGTRDGQEEHLYSQEKVRQDA